jgi:hypothetical protein
VSNPYQSPSQDPSREPYPSHGQDDHPYGTPYPSQGQDDHPYGTPYPGGYVQPYPGGYGSVGNHPQGTLILVFGIAGFFVGVLGPVAWVMGSRALKEIRASGSHPANEQQIVVGRILGIIVTVLLVLGFLLTMLLIVLAVAAATVQ